MAKIKGKQLETGTVTANEIDTTDGTISTINAGDAASEGSGAGLSRRDHQHSVSTAAPAATTVSAGTPSEGTASSLMRSDAAIQADTSGTLDSLAVGQTGADGTGDGLALKTHSHAVPAASAAEITDSTNSSGSSGNFVHSDHQHAHGNRGGGTLHSTATPSTAGFLSAADKTKLDALIDPNLRDPKDSVRLLTNSNVATLSGNQSVDGITTAPGERVGLFGQSTVTEDGIYITAAGAWSRSADFQAGSGQAGAVIPVEEGNTNADSIYLITNDAGTDVVGTDDLVALKFAAGTPRGAGAGLVLNGNDLDVGANADGSITVNADDIQVGILATDAQHGARGGGTQHALAVAAGAAGFLSGSDKSKLDGVTAGAEPNDTPRQERVTTETITNADVTLTDALDFTPVSNASVSLYLNGLHQIQGAGEDYTISGTAITWLASTGTAVNMKTTDDLVAVYLS